MAARIAYGYGASGITALKFDAPINEEFVDPTTIEGFRSAMGSINVYSKEKNFKNTLVNYDIANVDTYETYKNVFYVNSGSTDSALTTANSYYFCDGGNWPTKYNKLRYPYPTDLEQKIADGFPIKFNFTQYDKNENGFWNSLYNTMSRTEIKDAYWGADLFAGSNVPRMNLIFNPTVGTTDGVSVSGTTNAVLDNCFEGCTNLKSVTLTRKDDEKIFDNLKNVFKDCTSISSITFNAVDNQGVTSNAKWNVGQLEGAFKNCSSMTSWPNNIVMSGNQFDDEYANDMVVYIPNAFEGSGFQTIGSSEEFKVGGAKEAFKNSSAVTINATLDLRYIHPEIVGNSGNTEHVKDMFNSHQIETIELKNVNHNSWSFDNGSREGFYHIGDCSSFNQNSVEYLFNNLYDLTSNANAENILRRKPTMPKFNEWNAGTGVSIVDDITVNFSQSLGMLTISNVNGKFFKFTVSNMTSGDQLSVTGGDDILVITQNGDYYVNITTSTCSILANQVNSNITISYITTWNGEVDSVTNASLYCPAEWDNAEHERVITDDMVTIATNRGWMVYVNNQLHTVRVEVVLDDNSLNVGQTTTAKVYFVRTRGAAETRTEITSETGITYYSTDSSIASVDGNGEVTANGNGTAYIYVEYNGLVSSIVADEAKEEVTSTEYWQLLLNPSASTVSESNPTTQYTSTYRHYLNGVTTDTDATSAATWSISNDVSPYISINQGLVTWQNNPANNIDGTVNAEFSGISSSSVTDATITVVHSPEEYKLRIEPVSGGTLTEINDTVQFTTYYEFWRNNVLINTTDVTSAATWSLGDAISAYTSMNQGLVTKTVNPINTVQDVVDANYNGINSDNTPTVTVAHKVIVTYRIELTLANNSIDYNTTTTSQVNLIELHDDVPYGSPIDITTACTYISSDNSIASVNNAGVVTGVNGGTTNINAQYVYNGNTYTDSKQITVNNVITYRIDITSPVSVETSETGQCIAYYVTIVNGQDTTSVNVTTAAIWSSNNTSILTIGTNTGIITGQTPGSTTVTCTYSDISGTSNTISISDARLTRIEVDITNVPTIPASGGTVTSGTPGVAYTITAWYANGTSGDVTTDITVIKSGNTVSAATLGSGVTINPTPCTPDLKIEALYEDKYDSDEVTIYQDINSASTPIQYSAWTVSSATTYSIGVNSSITDLSKNGGTQSNPVTGSSQTPWNQITRYETSYSSGVKSYEDIVTSAWTATSEETVIVSSAPSWVSNITTGITGQFSYSSNSGPDRDDYIVYGLTNSTGTTGETHVYQNGTYEISVSPYDFRNTSSDGLTASTQIKLTNLDYWEVEGDTIPDWLTIYPLTGINNSVVTIEIGSNSSTSPRPASDYNSIYFRGFVNGESTYRDSDDIWVSQNGKPVVVDRIEVTNVSAPDIPAGGGSVRWDTPGVNYAVTAYYSDSTSGNVKSSAYVYSNTVSAPSKGTSAITRDPVGDLIIAAEYSNCTDSGSTMVYQQENEIVDTWYGDWRTRHIDSASTYIAYYNIFVEKNRIPASGNLSWESGTTDNDVYGTSSAFTTDVYQSARTWYNKWTSGEDSIDFVEYDGTTAITSESYSDEEVAEVRTITGDTDLITSVTPDKTNGTISYSQNDSTSDRSATIIYQLVNNSETTGSTTIYQEGAPVYITRIEVVITDAPDIPASGGTVTSGDVSYSVIAWYSDSTSGDVTSQATITGSSEVYHQSWGTTETGVTTAGTITIYAEYNNMTDNDTVNILQEANEVIDNGSIQNDVNTGTTAWTDYGSIYYDIDVTPSAQTVSSGSGSFNISVSASAITPYTTYTAETYQIEETPWSAYTSTASGWGQTVVDPEVYKRNTSETGSGESAVSTGASVQSSHTWLTANTNTISYDANSNPSERSDTVVYQVNGHSDVTDSCVVTQAAAAIQTRTVTIVPNGTMTIEHSWGSIEADGCYFEMESPDGEGIIRYETDSIIPMSQNTYNSSGYIIVDNVTTAATTIYVEITVADFNRVGHLYGQFNYWVDIDCETSGAASQPTGKYTVSIPVSQGTSNITVDLLAGGNPTLIFDNSPLN